MPLPRPARCALQAPGAPSEPRVWALKAQVGRIGGKEGEHCLLIHRSRRSATSASYAHPSRPSHRLGLGLPPTAGARHTHGGCLRLRSQGLRSVWFGLCSGRRENAPPSPDPVLLACLQASSQSRSLASRLAGVPSPRLLARRTDSRSSVRRQQPRVERKHALVQATTPSLRQPPGSVTSTPSVCSPG